MADSSSQQHSLPVLSVSVNAAVRWYGVLAVTAWIATLVGVITGGGAVALWFMQFPQVASVLALLSSVWLLASAALVPASVLASGRRRLVEAADAAVVTRQQRLAALQARANHAQAPQAIFSGSDEPDIIFQAERERLLRLSGWPQTVMAFPQLLAAMALVIWLWPVNGIIPWGFGIGVTCLVMAFPVLVFERRLSAAASAKGSDLPESGSLSRFMRVTLWGLMLIGAGEIARSLGGSFVIWAMWIYAGLVVVIATEALLRVLIAPFLPAADIEESRGLCDSVVAGLVLPRLGAGQSTIAGLKERFGIDLSQSWALGFVRRVSGPLILALLFFSWLLTGVTMVSLHERGVYERGGQPVAVLNSGMHVHLPWPFGIVRRMDAGRVYQVTLADNKLETQARIAADAINTAAFDRIWNKDHTADAVYVVPGTARGENDIRAPQVLGSDVRIYYRIGQRDEDAIRALYSLADPEFTIRALARRELMRVFSSRTLISAIGENRASLATEVKTAVQQALNQEQSGLEITAVTVDSIHPPANAAADYHGVQESEIISDTEVIEQQGDSAKELSEKQTEAIVAERNAQLLAVQKVSEAKIEQFKFMAEAQAWTVSGEVQALERWLQVLGKSLSRSELFIIDHRLNLVDGPVLDLRRFATPAEAP
jgi:regulator of protease activity HflC (stomatin/prohibitin superfamily)